MHNASKSAFRTDQPAIGLQKTFPSQLNIHSKSSASPASAVDQLKANPFTL